LEKQKEKEKQELELKARKKREELAGKYPAVAEWLEKVKNRKKRNMNELKHE